MNPNRLFEFSLKAECFAIKPQLSALLTVGPQQPRCSIFKEIPLENDATDRRTWPGPAVRDLGLHLPEAKRESCWSLPRPGCSENHIGK